jgi:hypothetical protein
MYNKLETEPPLQAVFVIELSTITPLNFANRINLFGKLTPKIVKI